MSHTVIKAGSQSEWEGFASFSNDASTTMPPCGTAACIAGWANLLTGANENIQDGEARERAAAKLGVEPGDDFISHPLFYADRWPEPFASRYRKAGRPQSRANIAAARIEHLIKTGK